MLRMSSHQQSRLFCFGLGYSALALVQKLKPLGWQIAGTVRTEAAAVALRAQGIEVFVFDGTRPLSNAKAVLADTTHLLSSIPPDVGGDPVVVCHGADIAGCEALVWAGYLSTTGVYGDRDGGWVDENAALQPTSVRSEQRFAAEQAWLGLHKRRGVPCHLFRLAGIYGPGRSALDLVRRGTAKRIDKPGQVFSRIHVDDIAAVLMASIAQPNPGRIYNVCDDNPASPAAVTAFACELLSRPLPPLVPFDEAEMSPMARSFYRDNKRVDNHRIKEELAVELIYPDYKAGLKAILAAER